MATGLLSSPKRTHDRFVDEARHQEDNMAKGQLRSRREKKTGDKNKKKKGLLPPAAPSLCAANAARRANSSI
jgi:hypothetical protein